MNFRSAAAGVLGASIFAALVCAQVRESTPRKTTPAEIAPGPPQVRVGDIVGKTVLSSNGEPYGVIHDLLIESGTGQIVFAGLQAGDNVALRRVIIPVPWGLFSVTGQLDRLVLPVSRETLRRAPAYQHEEWPNIRRSEWPRIINAFYRDEPAQAAE